MGTDASVMKPPTLSVKMLQSRTDFAIAQILPAEGGSFADWFSRHERTLTRFIYRQVPCTMDVEDILQVTFVRAMRGYARFDGRSAISTWLLGIAANVIRHHVRSKARRQRLERHLQVTFGDGRETRLSERIEAKHSLVAANDALKRLDSDKRQAFVLCELEGLTAREAAQTLGATETTVWKRVSDTRKILRRAMLESSL